MKCIPVKRIPSPLQSKHVQYVGKMRAAYLWHYPPSDSNLYVNNLRIECIKLTATHLRQVPSPTEIIRVNERLQPSSRHTIQGLSTVVARYHFAKGREREYD